MYRFRESDIFASEIAALLGYDFDGDDFVVRKPSSSSRFASNTFFFLESVDDFPADRIKKHREVLVISPTKIIGYEAYCSVVVIQNPKLGFIKAVNEFYIEDDTAQIAASAKIHPSARLGKNVSVGENVVIGAQVSIGDGSRILNNVVISGHVEIGAKCIIKDNATIGSQGYNFETDEDGVPWQYPHIGQIHIADNVWIGANSTIESGLLEDTLIGTNVKIDDLVQIGGSSRIAENSMIASGVVICRNAVIGKNCWLAPNASIRDDLKIADNVIVGLGAVVIHNLEISGATYVGNPASLLRK